MLGIIGISPVPENGVSNFWSAAPVVDSSIITINNNKIPEFVAGSIITFKWFETWIPQAIYYKNNIDSASVNDIVVNETAFWGNSSTTNGISVLSPYLTTDYSILGGNIVWNDSGSYSIISGTNEAKLEGFEYGQTFRLSDFAPAGYTQNGVGFKVHHTGGIYGQMISYGDNNGIPIFQYWDENVVAHTVSPAPNTQQFKIKVTSTAFEIYQGSTLLTSKARTFTDSTSGGILGTVGAYPTNGTNSIDTTGLALGTYNISSSANDNQTASAKFKIVPVRPHITTTTLSNGIVGTSYSATLAATLGILPYTWSLSSGSLPPGLTLNSSGVISGTPTNGGIYTFIIKVTDDNNQTDQKEFTITIPAHVTITNSPPSGKSCWGQGEVINLHVDTGTITSVVSLTGGLTGSTSGIGSPNATFTVSHHFNTQTSAVIRVTTSGGNFEDFAILICPMLPPITNILDDPSITTDDATNLPPSSIYQCVGVTVDVRGPSFLTGDVTWSVLDSSNTPVSSGVTFTGQNTVEATITLDNTVTPGNYTIKAVETATPSNVSLHSFTLLELPAVTTTTSQAYVGGHTQFTTIYSGSKTWATAPEVNASTGLATWTSAGTKTVSYTPTGGSCSKSVSYIVYNDISVAEYDNINCLYIGSGDTLQLTVTGGSGSHSFSINGQNTVSSGGLITAGIYAGNYIVSVIDNVAGIVKSIPVCVGTQSQFCTAIEAKECSTEGDVDPCCELSVECGETITLRVPSFHMRVNGVQEEILYSSSGLGVTGIGGYLKSGSAVTDAAANIINLKNPESLFEIITSIDMGDVANAPFGVGFSKQDVPSGVNTIDIGVVWFTSAGVRKVEIRKEGVAMLGSTFSVLTGDVISAGYKDGKFVLYINNLLRFETDDFESCGSQFLDISIEEPNKSIGGNVSGLTWTITTPGLPSEVGTINGDGIYNSPVDNSFSLIEAQASVGSATFRVRIRNIKPTVRYTKPKAFLAGKAVTLWVGPYITGMNEPIRLAKDGSPDAIQNPGMIDTGTLEGSANFQEAFDYQDFENDLGQIYNTSLVKESATLTGTFLEVRDLHKMSKLKPEATLYSKNKGVIEFSVGGKSCDLKELRVIMVIGTPGCDDTYDVLYLPRVQNKGNLGLEVGKKTNGKYELSLTALPDYSRPTGKQLYSIYQIDNCSSVSCG